MVLRSISRKSGIGQLIKYIAKNQEKSSGSLFWNLETNKDDTKSVENEFVRNNKYAPKRKNGNVIYHEIISFSKEDKEQLNEEILLDVAREYIELRSPNSLALARHL